MPPEPVAAGDLAAARESLELERLRLENRKLEAELRQASATTWDRLQRLGPSLSGLLAVAAFLFGVYQYREQQDRTLVARAEEQRRESAARDQEFMRPLWERELATYFRTSEVVATMATTHNQTELRTAEAEFWKLYVGPLVILETKPLSDAMVLFGRCYDGTERCDGPAVRHRALAVSTAIQQAVEEHASRRLSEFSKDKYKYWGPEVDPARTDR
jgi:hypothetical protein